MIRRIDPVEGVSQGSVGKVFYKVLRKVFHKDASRSDLPKDLPKDLASAPTPPAPSKSCSHPPPLKTTSSCRWR